MDLFTHTNDSELLIYSLLSTYSIYIKLIIFVLFLILFTNSKTIEQHIRILNRFIIIICVFLISDIIESYVTAAYLKNLSKNFTNEHHIIYKTIDTKVNNLESKTNEMIGKIYDDYKIDVIINDSLSGKKIKKTP